MGRAQVDVIVENLYRQRIHLHRYSVRCDFSKTNARRPCSELQSQKKTNDSARTHRRPEKKMWGEKKLERMEVTSSDVEAIFLYLFFVSASHHLKGNTSEQTNLLSEFDSFCFYLFLHSANTFFSIVIVSESSGATIRFHSICSRSVGDNKQR